ncbi:MAG: hypothetical protein RID53_16985 [Coleofasciculus sp. B1-GNL1-01]|uniref:hypothetical protein n=1 Tax=Coleofasciculus sp. B1-GNL1-01 TaxID=3068484 RepID=UPI0032F72DB4
MQYQSVVIVVTINPKKAGEVTCQQLGVAVQGKWKACPLAISPFTTYAEHLDGVDCGFIHR